MIISEREIKDHAEALANKYVAMCSKKSVKILKLAAKRAKEILDVNKKDIYPNSKVTMSNPTPDIFTFTKKVRRKR